jgi:imidazolonepropionase-like amidohydrolase
VRIGYGSDVCCGTANLAEFKALVRHGLTPLEALRAATSTAAEILGVTDRGVIKAGLVADIVGVAGNPIADVNSLVDVRFVMKAGVVYVRP